jgi:hypothetical protein
MTDIFDYLMVWTAPDDQENDMDCARNRMVWSAPDDQPGLGSLMIAHQARAHSNRMKTTSTRRIGVKGAHNL